METDYALRNHQDPSTLAEEDCETRRASEIYKGPTRKREDKNHLW